MNNSDYFGQECYLDLLCVLARSAQAIFADLRIFLASVRGKVVRSMVFSVVPGGRLRAHFKSAGA